MAYLTRSDLEIYMEAEEIDQIIDGNDDIITAVIRDAEAYAREMLIQRYDIDTEYTQTGTDRAPSLVKQVTAISLFFLSERLNTNLQTEARVMAYENAESWLKEISKGERNLNITEANSDEKQGYPVVWGSQPRTDNYL